MSALVGSPDRFVLRDGDRYFMVDCKDHDVAMRVALNRCYEPVVGALFLSQVKPGAIVFDVGANKGYYTLLACEKVGQEGQVFAYEPDPRNVADLEATCQLNASANFKVIAKALSGSEGEARFDLSGWAEENSAWGKVLDQCEQSTNFVSVQTCRLDDEMQQHNLKAIGMLKMDIQGGEKDAVLGMTAALDEHRIDACLVELHDMQLDELQSHGVVNAFFERGYDGRAYDQLDFAESEAMAFINNGQPLDLKHRGIAAKDYSYKRRRESGGYVKPLQFLLRSPNTLNL